MKNKFDKFDRNFSIGLVCFILLYALSVGVRSYNKEYRTELPYVFELSNQYATQGIIIRDEQEYVKNYDGYINYVVEDGKKVLPSSVVAKEYNSESDLISDTNIEKTKIIYDKILNLEKQNNNVIKDIDTLNFNVFSALKPFMMMKRQSNTSHLNDIKYDIVESIIAGKIKTGKNIDFSDIKDKLSKIKENNIQHNNYVAGFRGIFSSYVDGYEDKLTPDIIKNISFDSFNDLMNNDYSRKEKSFGKNIKNINWYYITVVPSYVSKTFESSPKIYMTIGSNKKTKISGTVVKTLDDLDKEQSLVVIKSNDINPNTVGNRKVNINIGFQNLNGIRFNSKALRIINGEQGVFIKGKSSVKFKKVKIIYKGPDFYLSKLNYADGEYLSIFDEVIIKGRNLYDGKEL